MITGQIRVTTTGAALQLPSSTLANGVIITAESTNSAQCVVGGAGVTTVTDGTGNGYSVDPRKRPSISLAVANLNTVYVNGAAGDVFFFAGS